MTISIEHDHAPSDGDVLPRLIWAAMTCDPDDPAPPWELLTPAQHHYWADRAEAMRRRIDEADWLAPPEYRRRLEIR